MNICKHDDFHMTKMAAMSIYHCGESKTQRKWFLDEKRDGLVDDNRINNQQNEKQQKVYTLKNHSVDLFCFKQ